MNEQEVKRRMQTLQDIAKNLDLIPADSSYTIASGGELVMVASSNHIPLPAYWAIRLEFRAEIKKVE